MTNIIRSVKKPEHGGDCCKVTNFAKNQASRDLLPLTGQLKRSQGAKASVTRCLPAVLLLGLLSPIPKMGRQLLFLIIAHNRSFYLQSQQCRWHSLHHGTSDSYLLLPKRGRERIKQPLKKSEKMGFLNRKGTERITLHIATGTLLESFPS